MAKCHTMCDANTMDAGHWLYLTSLDEQVVKGPKGHDPLCGLLCDESRALLFYMSNVIQNTFCIDFKGRLLPLGAAACRRMEHLTK